MWAAKGPMHGCRKKSMSSVDKTITRKLVQNAVGKAVRTAGKNLGEVPLHVILACLAL